MVAVARNGVEMGVSRELRLADGVEGPRRLDGRVREEEGVQHMRREAHEELDLWDGVEGVARWRAEGGERLVVVGVRGADGQLPDKHRLHPRRVEWKDHVGE